MDVAIIVKAFLKCGIAITLDGIEYNFLQYEPDRRTKSRYIVLKQISVNRVTSYY